MKTNHKRIFIVGAGAAGKDVLREIKQSPDLHIKVVGFIDDKEELGGRFVDGVKVLGGFQKLTLLIHKHKITEVIIAIPSAYGERVAEYVKVCSDSKIAFRIVPRVKEIIQGKAQVKTLRKVRIEDLLGRPIVKSKVGELREFFRGKCILVTGAAGSIGSELVRQIAAYDPECVICMDAWENGIFLLRNELLELFPKQTFYFVISNIRDKKKVEAVFSDYKPQFVFHAAAYKHVPLMEENADEAVKNNVFGTLNVANAAKKYSVERFVIISTDKAADPVSIMGATKLITEAIGRKLNGKTRFMAVRFGNVLGSNGSVVPLFNRQIEKGGPITITDKRMTRYFMTIPEAVQLILKACSMGKGGELFVLDMGHPVKILNLAENLIRLSGLIPYKDIQIIETGKRKGEKLKEKLFTQKEELARTHEEKIFIGKSDGIDINKLPKSLLRLKQSAESGDKAGICKELSHLIKSFPKNS